MKTRSFARSFLWFVILALFAASFTVAPAYARPMDDSDGTPAGGEDSVTADFLLNLTPGEALDFFLSKGLILPDDFAHHRDMAENYMELYLPLVLSGAMDPDMPNFNYSQSNELLRGLGEVLDSLGIDYQRGISSTRYTLVDSTKIGTWNTSYLYYNCYAYAINQSGLGGISPGSISGTSFSLSMTMDAIANVVLADLAYLNCWGYKTTTKPTSLPDEYFHLIAVRKDNSKTDYHFMKMYATSPNQWSHKPGGTQPLLWNYTSPGYKIWTNENSRYNVDYSGTVTYESSIVYIIYKNYNDPGIQIWPYDSIEPIQ